MSPSPPTCSGVSSREAIDKAAAEARDARKLLIALIVVLAAHEDATGVDSWRSDSDTTHPYLGWLADNWYPVSDVEVLAGPKGKAKRN